MHRLARPHLDVRNSHDRLLLEQCPLHMRDPGDAAKYTDGELLAFSASMC